MKSTILAVALLLISSVAIAALPFLLNISEKKFTTVDIPSNNTATLGVQIYSLPPHSQGILPPNLSARAIFIKDLSSSSVLYKKDADIKVPIASTTKIVTALIASQYFKQNSVLTVKDAASIGGSKIDLKYGEQLSFRSLLYGMLLNSGNDAAFAIAENYPGGVKGFVTAMNLEANKLNLLNTHFENPAGFDSPEHFSSAADLSTLTEEALKDDELAKIVATKSTEVTSLDKRFTHKLQNLNRLLSQVSGVLGVKTGYTELAKENLVTLVERDGHKVLLVVLGSDDRFGETTSLINWVFGNYQWFN